MEAPAPISSITPKFNKVENILEKKEYKLKIDNKPYIFTISHDNKFIYFIIIEQSNIPFFKYKIDYDLQNIIQDLKLNVHFYNDFNKILELLDKIYLDKKMIINYNKEDDSFNIKIKLYDYFQEYDSYIILKKKELENNEKFDIIIKEIKSIKNDKINDEKLEMITKSLNNLKISNNKKLNQNEYLIKLLQQKIAKNEKLLKTNEKEIQLLKNEIFKLKEIISDKKNNIEEIKDIIKLEKCNDNYILANQTSLNYKISIIGSCGIGKSSIVQKYLSLPINDRAHTSYYAYNTYLKVNGDLIRIEIFDHPGQEKIRSISLAFSKISDLIVFIYKDDYSSFEYAKGLIKEAKQNCKENVHYALIYSLPDLKNGKKLSKEEGEELAKNENMDLFMEVSHYTGYNIDNMFFEIAKILYRDRK